MSQIPRLLRTALICMGLGVGLLLLIPTHACAQERWLIAANAADAASTIYALQQPGLREGNPLLGAHPSPLRIVAFKTVGTAAQVWALRRVARSRPRTAKVLTIVAAALYTGVAAHNMRLAVAR